jgi:hypothetical protein
VPKEKEKKKTKGKKRKKKKKENTVYRLPGNNSHISNHLAAVAETTNTFIIWP